MKKPNLEENIERYFSPWRSALLSMALALCALPNHATGVHSESANRNLSSDMQADAATASLVQRLSPAVFTLLILNDADSTTDPVAQGSGFLVGQSGKAVTAFHVISDTFKKNDARIQAVFSDGTRLGVRVLRFNALDDLALLELEGKPGPFKSIRMPDSTQPPPAGSALVSMGNPAQTGMAFVRGQLTVTESMPGTERLVCACPISSGMSGGPTVSMSGLLVGVNVAMHNRAKQVGYLAPAHRVHALMSAYEREMPGPRANTPAPGNAQHLQSIQDQVTNAQDMLGNLLINSRARQKKVWGSYRAADLLPEQLKCSTSNDKPERDAQTGAEKDADPDLRTAAQRFITTERVCKLKQPILSVNALNVNLQYSVRHVQQTKAGNRFHLARQVDGIALPTVTTKSTETNHPTQCIDRTTLAGPSGALPVRVVVCASHYKAYAQARDVLIRIRTLDRPDEALVLSLFLEGVSPQLATLLIAQLLEQLQ